MNYLSDEKEENGSHTVQGDDLVTKTLASLARRTADRVAKSGRYSRLDPMNPSDRRIIHTTLQEDDRVTTLSKGSEPHRYVIVFPKEQD